MSQVKFSFSLSETLRNCPKKKPIVEERIVYGARKEFDKPYPLSGCHLFFSFFILRGGGLRQFFDKFLKIDGKDKLWESLPFWVVSRKKQLCRRAPT